MAESFNESAFLAYQAFRELADHEMNLATSLFEFIVMLWFQYIFWMDSR